MRRNLNLVGLLLLFLAAPLEAAPLEAAPLEAAPLEAAPEKTGAKLLIHSPTLEEIVVLGTLYSQADELSDRRRSLAEVSNLLGAEEMSRVGDSHVAAALKRVPGLTLVGGQFIYVRGLGERYASTTLNGARVPSPDLSRSVLPLDIFQASMISSVEVLKTYNARLPAHFGGGHIDIRTKNIPEGLVYGIELGFGANTQTGRRVMTYPGGARDNLGQDDGTRALPRTLAEALVTYGGDISPVSIALQDDATFADAQQQNRMLALSLNRRLDFESVRPGPDLSLKGHLGDSYELGQRLKLGFLAGFGYSSAWQRTEQLRRNLTFPEERTDTRLAFARDVKLTGHINLGLDWAKEHQVYYTFLFLRNAEDTTSTNTFFNANRERSGGLGFHNQSLQFEERQLRVHQLRGAHQFGYETIHLMQARADRLGKGRPLCKPSCWYEGLRLNWHLSYAQSNTDIPNQVRAAFLAQTDPATGAPHATQLRLSSQALDYRFTKLGDVVGDVGVNIHLPVAWKTASLTLSTGFVYSWRKRRYEQLQFSLGPLGRSDPADFVGTLGNILSDAAILNPGNEYAFIRTSSNTESYEARTSIPALFISGDWSHDSGVRVVAGIRYEKYNQSTFEYDPLARFKGTSGGYGDDALFPSLTLLWQREQSDDRTVQLRLSYARTVTRPDLREITDASYIDPITDYLVSGSAQVRPARIDGLDVRADWFSGRHNRFSIAAFHKEIDKPIEFFETAASDTTVAQQILNAQSAQLTGVEFEFLMNLEALHPSLALLDLTCNLTLQKTKIVAGDQADAPTSPIRQMTNAAPVTANVRLTFNAPNARHEAVLAYNVSSKRLYLAGRAGAPDAYEQPFHSLDFNYRFYPQNRLEFQFKVGNLLNQRSRVTRSNVVVFEQGQGMNLAFETSWSF